MMNEQRPLCCCLIAGHLSGGQLNPAVTLGLVLTGALHPIQGIANVCAQV